MKRYGHRQNRRVGEREESPRPERRYMLPNDIRRVLEALERKKGIMPHTDPQLTLSWRLAYLIPWYKENLKENEAKDVPIPWQPLKRPVDKKQKKWDWPLAGLGEKLGSSDQNFKPRFGEKGVMSVFRSSFSATAQSLRRQGYLTGTFTLRTDWRLVVGLGAAHVADTAMTIHRIYSVPYIPGSALKGITRDWAREQMKNRASAFWNEKTFLLAFGSPHNEPQSPKNRGVALFLDAFPKGGFTIRVDVMTPHFPTYYRGEGPPADWDSPTPIEFLTVEDTEFEFLIAVDAYRLRKLQDCLLYTSPSPRD